MMRRARAIMVIALIVFAAPAGADLDPSGSLKYSPGKIVENYVRLDMKGARLDARSFDTLRPYVEWNEEPAWHTIVVVKDVDVPDDYRKWDVIDNLDVVIPVVFHVHGSVHFGTAAFIPEERTEEVRFHVKAVRNSWRTIDPMIPPHVGLKRILNFVREAELSEQDAEQRTVLTSLKQSLQKAK